MALQNVSFWDRGLFGTGDKSQIWKSLDQIANRDMKKEKRKINGTQTLTRGTTSKDFTIIIFHKILNYFGLKMSTVPNNV